MRLCQADLVAGGRAMFVQQQPGRDGISTRARDSQHSGPASDHFFLSQEPALLPCFPAAGHPPAIVLNSLF